MGGNLLKLSAQTNFPVLLHIVNLPIREGRFCMRWKFHLIILHHKKRDRQSPDIYRQVCHLVEVGRVVKLVVWDQLQTHDVNNGIIHLNHYGSTLNMTA